MTTNDTTTAADLEKQAHDAEAQARQLEQRVLDGDEDVTHDQISEAHSQSGFLRLRAEGKRRKEEREAREARRSAALSLHADAVALAPTDPMRPTSAAAKAAAKTIAGAFAKYLAAVRSYDDEAMPLVARANELGVPPWGDDLEGLSFSGGANLMARTDAATVWSVTSSSPQALESSIQQVLQDAMASLPREEQVRLR